MGVVVLVLGAIVIFVPAFWLRYKLSRYEFEHRTSGGVIEFPSYGASKRHAAKKLLYRLLDLIGALWIVIGAVVVFLSTRQ